MKVFLFGEFNAENCAIIFQGKETENYNLLGYEMLYDTCGKSFVYKCPQSKIEGFLIDLSEDELWKVDQWKNVFQIKRFTISGFKTYFNADDIFSTADSPVSNQEVIDFFTKEQHDSIAHGDIHLLIPGYLKNVNNIPFCANNVCKFLNNNITKSNNDEFADSFIKDNTRYSLGKCILKINGFALVQNAAIVMMVHNETQLSVIDIFIPYISISTHKLLTAYCQNDIDVFISGENYSLEEFFSKYNFTPYGSKRSLVFSYNEMDESMLLKLLVNEDKPMGSIMGSHFINIINNNLAQYDTAKVFASETTMVEITKEKPCNIEERIASQAIEIFFVEMLLLQDAAVSKMNFRVKKEVIRARKNPFRKNSKSIIDELVYEMSYAINFADYKQFHFPTVRVSAEKVAKAFGIDYILNKYEQNKVLLERMISGHDAAIKEKENSIKNRLLVIITLFSAIKTINEAINMFTRNEYSAISFWIALGATIVGAGLYFLFVFSARKKLIKKLARQEQYDE